MLLTDTGPVEKHSCAGFVEFPVNKVVEALCVRDTGQIGDAIGEAVDIARSNEMTEMEFAGYLGAVINDKRLMPQFAAGLKLDLYDEISNAVSFEGLKAGLIQTINFAGMDESKVDRKTMVSQIEQYLRDNYTSSISNEMLAALFGFVPSYISKIFRAHSGLSPAEYLIKLRVEKAKELLETRRELLVKEVSQLVGYDDQYYFSKVFKKATGLWPTQYQIGQIENQAKN